MRRSAQTRINSRIQGGVVEHMAKIGDYITVPDYATMGTVG